MRHHYDECASTPHLSERAVGAVATLRQIAEVVFFAACIGFLIVGLPVAIYLTSSGVCQ